MTDRQTTGFDWIVIGIVVVLLVIVIFAAKACGL